MSVKPEAFVLFQEAFSEFISGCKPIFVTFILFLSQSSLKFVLRMNALYIFFILFGLLKIVQLKGCSPLSSPQHGEVTCFLDGKKLNCGSNLPHGTVAEFRCQEFYEVSGDKKIKCRINGTWTLQKPRCVPECGREGKVVSLIVNGLVAPFGAFPWHVAIYNWIDDRYEYWCGGSLMSTTAVITAAHCAWQTTPEGLILIFGKFHREFELSEPTAQKIRAKKIEVLTSYQDVTGNYNGDVAVIFLERPVVLGHHVTPVCIDWEQRLMEKQLTEGMRGVVLGWGLTENDTLSDVLRMVTLPVVSDEKCIAKQEENFKKFVTYTSFCAGFGNGTGVCNGDSGGGLTFYDETTDRWYLQGLVSVSPRRKGTSYCDPNYYTVFTKVAMFSKWLKTITDSEDDFWKKYFGRNGIFVHRGRFSYPISKKMAEFSKNHKR